MNTNLTGDFSKETITLKLAGNGIVRYHANEPKQIESKSIFIILNRQRVVGLSFGSIENDAAGKNIYLELIVPETIVPAEFFYFLTLEMDKAGYEMNVGYSMSVSPASMKKFQKYWRTILPLLQAFGLQLAKQTKRSAAKPRHKFDPKLVDQPFSIDYKGSQATVYWKKRNEFVIKKGATLVENAPLTKAGVIGFAGKFGLRLRDEHAAAIENSRLIEDVTLRSVNEVGTFLYFAGTNSWLQLKSPDNKTLHDLTVVK